VIGSRFDSGREVFDPKHGAIFPTELESSLFDLDGKTRYLSELSAGDPVLLVDFNGHTTVCTVGRVKIEKRPLMLVTALVGDKSVSTIVQNAETIRLTAPDGQPVSIVSLNPGDQILVATEEAGRHFGHKIEESIVER